MVDLLKARESLHRFIDPMWQEGLVSRESIYKEMSAVLGKEAHVANMSLEELERCASYFIDRDKEKFPCKRCENLVTFRHFIPVCSENIERSSACCGKFVEKDI